MKPILADIWELSKYQNSPKFRLPLSNNVLMMFWLCSGYMAPEYASHGRFSAKSDVFSFGVLILELVSGKMNSWLDSSGDVVHLLSYVSMLVFPQHQKPFFSTKIPRCEKTFSMI